MHSFVICHLPFTLEAAIKEFGGFDAILFVDLEIRKCNSKLICDIIIPRWYKRFPGPFPYQYTYTFTKEWI